MWRLMKGLLIVTSLFLLACEKGEIVQAVDPLIELYAVYVTSELKVDGRANDDVWQKAKPYTVHVFENPEEGESIDLKTGFNVTLKAIWWKSWMLSTDNWIERPFMSILLTWPDNTKNISKNTWYYNPQDSVWTQSNEASDWLLFGWYNSNYTDLWYWDAALTNPWGYAEDQYIEEIYGDTTTTITIFNIDGTNYLNDYDTYRNSWDKNYNDNLTPRDSTDDFPKMAWKFDTDSIPPTLPRIYSSEDERYAFLFSQDAELFEKSPYSAMNKPVTIPGYILEDPIGPSTDIIAVACHENGYWTVEIVRPAATSDTNDIGFVPSSRYSVYHFFIAIGNNTPSPMEAGSKYYISSGYTSFTFEFVL